MEIIGIVLIVVILAVAFVFLLRSSTRGRGKSENPQATGAGEGHRPGVASDPTVDRPAGPTAETNMGPSPGVLHPDSQHDADGGTADQDSHAPEDPHRRAGPDQ